MRKITDISVEPIGVPTDLAPLFLDRSDKLHSVAVKLSINSGDDYEDADSWLSSYVDHELEKIDKIFKPLRRLEKELKEPLLKIKSIVQSVMLGYDRKVKQDFLETQRRMIEMAGQTAEEIRMIEINNLFQQGDESAAVKLGDSQTRPIRYPTAKPVGPKAEGRSVVTTWKYNVVDQDKIHPDYFVTQIDHEKIAHDVRKHKMEAEEIVGGIEVYPSTSMRKKPKKRNQ